MAGLTVLKKRGKIQNVVSSSDFELFYLEIHALKKISHLNFRAKINNFKNETDETCYDDFQTVCILPLKIGIVL